MEEKYNIAKVNWKMHVRHLKILKKEYLVTFLK